MTTDVSAGALRSLRYPWTLSTRLMAPDGYPTPVPALDEWQFVVAGHLGLLATYHRATWTLRCSSIKVTTLFGYRSTSKEALALRLAAIHYPNMPLALIYSASRRNLTAVSHSITIASPAKALHALPTNQAVRLNQTPP